MKQGLLLVFLTPHTVCDIIVFRDLKAKTFSLKFWVFRGNLFESNQQFGYFLINRKKNFLLFFHAMSLHGKDNSEIAKRHWAGYIVCGRKFQIKS